MTQTDEATNGAVATADLPAADYTDQVERISTDEMAYHNQVLNTARAAQAAFQSWASFLANKYKIGQNDRINEDGTISRNVPAPEQGVAQ